MTEVSLSERREIVNKHLRVDEIRDHRVGDPLELSQSQSQELNMLGEITGQFSLGMSEVSHIALQAGPGDKTMASVRQLLGTEGMYQAIRRGEAVYQPLPFPEITKADVILTHDGMRIAEIEPGKIRGIGYGLMTRLQSKNAPGIGSSKALQPLTGGESTAIVMSEADKFHEPEMDLLASQVPGLMAVRQHGRRLEQGSVRAIMMSKFHNNGTVSEDEIRAQLRVVSDRRPDLESKGALALLHNRGENPELEALLVNALGGEGSLARMREVIPVTDHVSLLNPEQSAQLRDDINAGRRLVFAKPLSTSGTRGIITPGSHEEMMTALASNKSLKKFVLQAACTTIKTTMRSVGVMSGEESEDDMNIRITIHVNRHGQLIETSVVGSPDDYLAHGGKTSVITNLEVPHHD